MLLKEHALVLSRIHGMEREMRESLLADPETWVLRRDFGPDFNLEISKGIRDHLKGNEQYRLLSNRLEVVMNKMRSQLSSGELNDQSNFSIAQNGQKDVYHD